MNSSRRDVHDPPGSVRWVRLYDELDHGRGTILYCTLVRRESCWDAMVYIENLVMEFEGVGARGARAEIPMNGYEEIQQGRRWVGAELGIMHGVYR